jgi:hypothetical protein
MLRTAALSATGATPSAAELHAVASVIVWAPVE